MKIIENSAVALLMAASASICFGGGGSGRDPAPQYDLKTEITIAGSIVEVSEAGSSKVLEGVFLKVKTKTETIDVYVAPGDFIKMLDFKFHKGDDLEATGSQVKFADSDLVLARTIVIGKTVLTFRDKSGTPQWLWMKRTAIPTGL